MKLQISLIFLILNGFILYGQEKTSTTSRYQKYPESGLDREKLLARVLGQKQLDYWEFWFVYSKDLQLYLLDDSSQKGKQICVHDVRMNGGKNQSKNNLHLINLTNPSSGFWNNPPGADTYNLAYVNNGKVVLVTSEDSLAEFLKPIKTIEQSILYSYLKGFSLLDVKYRNGGQGFFELQMQSDDIDREIRKKKGAIWIHSYYYLRISENGDIYREKIGEKRYRIRGIATP